MEYNNILKDNNFINYDTYEKIMLSRQYNKLYKKNLEKYKDKLKIKENIKIYNIYIYEISKNFSNTILVIINELTLYIHQENKNINQLMLIFSKNDRLIYVGILIFLIALIIYFIDVTN